jgi:hypothetical protein
MLKIKLIIVLLFLQSISYSQSFEYKVESNELIVRKSFNWVDKDYILDYPNITSVSSYNIGSGDTVLLQGENFGDYVGSIAILNNDIGFSSVVENIIEWTNSYIIFTVENLDFLSGQELYIRVVNVSGLSDDTIVYWEIEEIFYNFQILHISDTQEGWQYASNIFNSAINLGLQPNMLIHSGDNSWGGTADIDAAILNYQTNIDGPILLAIGNHDGINTPESNGENSEYIIGKICQVNMANENIVVPSFSEIPLFNQLHRGTNLMWNVGNVYIILLNPYMDYDGEYYHPWTTSGIQLYDVQLLWLEEMLAMTSETDDVFIVMHNPLKSIRDEDTSYLKYQYGILDGTVSGWEIEFYNLLQTYNVDYYITGHHHSYSIYNDSAYPDDSLNYNLNDIIQISSGEVGSTFSPSNLQTFGLFEIVNNNFYRYLSYRHEYNSELTVLE